MKCWIPESEISSSSSSEQEVGGQERRRRRIVPLSKMWKLQPYGARHVELMKEVVVRQRKNKLEPGDRERLIAYGYMLNLCVKDELAKYGHIRSIIEIQQEHLVKVRKWASENNMRVKLPKPKVNAKKAVKKKAPKKKAKGKGKREVKEEVKYEEDTASIADQTVSVYNEDHAQIATVSIGDETASIGDEIVSIGDKIVAIFLG